MNLTTDRTNQLIEIKNSNISKNILLKSSSIIFKNKLLEQKKYLPKQEESKEYQSNSSKILLILCFFIIINAKSEGISISPMKTVNGNDKEKRIISLFQEIDIQKFIKNVPIGKKLAKLLQE